MLSLCWSVFQWRFFAMYIDAIVNWFLQKNIRYFLDWNWEWLTLLQIIARRYRWSFTTIFLQQFLAENSVDFDTTNRWLFQTVHAWCHFKLLHDNHWQFAVFCGLRYRHRVAFLFGQPVNRRTKFIGSMISVLWVTCLSTADLIFRIPIRYHGFVYLKPVVCRFLMHM